MISQTAAWQTVNRQRLVGEVYIVRLLDPFVQQEQLQRDGFIWPLLRRFSDSLKMVFWQSLAINLLGLAVSFYVMYVYDKAIGGKSVDTLDPPLHRRAGGGWNGVAAAPPSRGSHSAAWRTL